MPLRIQNWLSVDDIATLVGVCEWEVVKMVHRFLVPKYVPVVSTVANRVVAKLPLVGRFGLMAYLVARPRTVSPSTSTATCSVIVPCRNERDTIEPAVLGNPGIGARTPLIFLRWGRTGGPRGETERSIQKYRRDQDRHL